MSPTFDVTSQFDREYKGLSVLEREAFKKAVEKLVEDLRSHKGFRKSLRVKGYQGREGVFEMTWAKDGRALFMYGAETIKGESHVIWLRIGGHEIFEVHRKEEIMGMPELSKVSPKGQVTLPASIRRIFNIQTGQSVTFTVTSTGILVKPVEVTVTDQTDRPEWERKLETALEDVKAGRVRRFKSEEEFMTYLQGVGEKKRTRKKAA